MPPEDEAYKQEQAEIAKDEHIQLDFSLKNLGLDLCISNVHVPPDIKASVLSCFEPHQNREGGNGGMTVFIGALRELLPSCNVLDFTVDLVPGE